MSDAADQPPPVPDAAAAVAALADQVDCYRRLAALGDEQTRLVLAGDSDGLLNLLGRRQSLTNSAAELESALAPLKRGWPDAAAAWPAGRREAARALLIESRDLLTELARRDDRDAATLRCLQATAGRELSRLNGSDRNVRRINQQYAAAAYRRRDGRVDVAR